MKVGIKEIEGNSSLRLNKTDIDKLVEKIGSQLGAVDEVIDWGKRYEGVVIVRVISCVKHENADSLNVCLVDDGGIAKNVERNPEGYVQVVCGAPNVREGILVAWIPPGVSVPNTFGSEDVFVIGAKELRGVMSNGMLASPSELYLSDDHSGLLEFDEDINGTTPKPGDYFAKAIGMDEIIIDIENKMFTHRPDCFGILGVAREISGIMGKAFESPSWYLETPSFEKIQKLPLSVSVETPGLVPRFMAVVMDNVQMADSPLWMQAQLRRIGIRSINNVVDVTNYVMYITGQPLHAYDYDKVAKLSSKGAEIIVRHPRANEKLQLLNGKTIVPRTDAVVIASSNESIGLGGVMGGGTTEVDKNTTRIIIEVASFDMYNIRKTSMHHGLFTDAVTRFSKGQSVHQNDRVLSYAIAQMMIFANATLASSVVDVKNDLKPNPKIILTPEFVNERLGIDLSIDAMEKLLGNVEFIVSKDKGQLHVTAPFWRTDIAINEDVVEEIGRLHGFDKLPLTLPEKSILPAIPNSILNLKSTIRDSLCRFGANEILSYSFVHGALMQQVGQDPTKAFSLSNALSPNLQYYRLTLTPSLLEKIHSNAKAGYDEFAIFELGKGHSLENSDDGSGVPVEFEKLAFVYSAQTKAVSKNSGEAYFKASYFLQALLTNLRINYALEAVKNTEAPFDPKRSATILEKKTGQVIGTIGEYTLKTLKGLKLSKLTAGFELDLQVLLKHAQQNVNYEVLSKYPKISQDISLKVTGATTYQMIASVIDETVASINQDTKTQTTVQPLDIFMNEEGEKHTTFRLIFSSLQRTLTTEEVSGFLDRIDEQLTKKLGAIRI